MIPSAVGSAGAVKTAQSAQAMTVTKASMSSTAVAVQGGTSDEVVSISKSMEKLLDGFTGAGKKADGSDSGGSSGGFASQSLSRARQAQSVMQGVLDASKSFQKSLNQGIGSLKDTLGSVLGQLGVPDDRISDVVDGFGKDLLQKAKGFDFSELSASAQSSTSQFTIESHGIDLIIQDGDRSLKISYAKSTLDFQRLDTSMQAQANSNGDQMVAFGAAATTADGKAEGMLINAKGFSADEVKQVLDRLNELASGKGAAAGTGGGLAVLTPEKKADGILKLKLNLSAVLPSLSAGDSTAAAAGSNGAAAGKVDLKA